MKKSGSHAFRLTMPISFGETLSVHVTCAGLFCVVLFSLLSFLEHSNNYDRLERMIIQIISLFVKFN